MAARAFLPRMFADVRIADLVDTRVDKVLFGLAPVCSLRMWVPCAAWIEVVLCAGALESPRLLQVSGIGPAEHLRAIGVHL
jgi:choline dehydrogenase-like flavoprotein